MQLKIDAQEQMPAGNMRDLRRRLEWGKLKNDE
jgi:hypothetical protein